MSRICASLSRSIVAISCEVRNPFEEMQERDPRRESRCLDDQRCIMRFLHRSGRQHGKPSGARRHDI
jgi:hypothetical protein